MIYGQEDDNAIITSYSNSNLELIDDYVELVEAIEERKEN